MKTQGLPGLIWQTYILSIPDANSIHCSASKGRDGALESWNPKCTWNTNKEVLKLVRVRTGMNDFLCKALKLVDPNTPLPKILPKYEKPRKGREEGR